MPKDLVNSCIRFKFLSLARLRRLFRAVLTDSEDVVESCCCCCSLAAATELVAASSPVNSRICNVITPFLSSPHIGNPVGLIIKFNHTLKLNNREEENTG